MIYLYDIQIYKALVEFRFYFDKMLIKYINKIIILR